MSDANLITVSKSKSQRELRRPALMGGTQKENRETALKQMTVEHLAVQSYEIQY
jgi:hypothetical protein